MERSVSIVKRTVSISLVAAALCAALAAPPASAHEAGDRAMGTVQSVTEDRIVIRASDGHPVAFKLTAETRFTRGDAPARRGDVLVGERAVVHGKRAGADVEAVHVRLGTPAGKR